MSRVAMFLFFAGCDPSAATDPSACAPSLEVSALSVDYGEVPVNALGRVEEQLLLSNAGSCDLKISAMTLEDGASAFELQGGPQVIPAGGTHAVSIAFQPEEDGTFSDTLTIESNDPAQPQVGLWLGGEGIAPRLSVEVPEIASVPFGCVDTLSVTLRNEGRANLSVAYRTHDELGIYLLTDGVQPLWLEPGASFPLLLEYQLLNRSGVGLLQLETNAPGQRDMDVFLGLDSDVEGWRAERHAYDGGAVVLEEEPIVETIEVSVNNSPIDAWQYDDETGSVVLEQVEAGAAVSVGYMPASACD